MFQQLLTTRRQEVSRGDLWRRIARAALFLLLMMILISPITQNIWRGDNILTGHDTETSLILALTLASLAILRMESSRTFLCDLFKRVRDILSSLFGAWLIRYLTDLTPRLLQPMTISHTRERPDENAGYLLPLLI
jgi:hypothetical protein